MVSAFSLAGAKTASATAPAFGSVGETKTILTKGPFTLTGECTLTDPTSMTFTVELKARSDEDGWTTGRFKPMPAGTDFVGRFFHHEEMWETGETNLIAPSGAQFTVEYSLGVHTFGSDCAEAVMLIG